MSSEKYEIVNVNEKVNALAAIATDRILTPDNKYKNAITLIKNQLINNSEPLKTKHQQYQKHIDQLMQCIQQVPTLDMLTETFSIDTPEFEYVEHQKTDTPEIKKMIDRLNEKAQTFDCDHTKYEALNDSFPIDLINLKRSANLMVVDKYYEQVAQNLYRIKKLDHDHESIYKEYDEDMDDETPEETISDEVQMIREMGDHLADELKKVTDKALAFNIEVLKFNNKYKHIECPKCKKMMKLYEYRLSEINRLRKEEEDRRQQEMQDIIREAAGGEDNDLISIADEDFKDIKRFPLMSVVKMYKAKYHKMITQGDAGDILEQTERYHITNVKNKRYCTRL